MVQRLLFNGKELIFDDRGLNPSRVTDLSSPSSMCPYRYHRVNSESYSICTTGLPPGVKAVEM
jgi:hypothetical protein